jgi:endonuclease YncB( thermonuclease family)
MCRLILVTFITLSLPLLAFAKPPIRIVYGSVVKVSDGDTIAVNSDGTKIKARLYGIDTPETEKGSRRTGRVSKEGQPYGEEAWKALEGKVDGQKVRLDIMDIDKYRRMIAIVWLGSRNINREMVAEGWAWAYTKYLRGPYASEFIQDEERARKKRLGLWKQYNPQPPWEFRMLLKNRKSFW